MELVSTVVAAVEDVEKYDHDAQLEPYWVFDEAEVELVSAVGAAVEEDVEKYDHDAQLWP